MGSTGSFLESGGFNAPAQWHTIDYIDGIKVIDPKDPKKRPNLPARSNTPGTTYISLNKDEGRTFNQLRVYDEKRMPVFDIDYGIHGKDKYLHVHYFVDGKRQSEPLRLHPGDDLYERYKRVFKGVKL